MVALSRKPGKGTSESVKDVLAQLVNHVLALTPSGAESEQLCSEITLPLGYNYGRW